VKLTVCLVTKGRDAYLPATLKSYETLIASGKVEVFILANGCSSSTIESLRAWVNKYPNESTLISVEPNESAGARNWKLIRENISGWVIIPGDDDILLPTLVDIWEMYAASNSKIGAIAMSGEMIDSDGKSLRKILHPALRGKENSSEALALALHEAPFFWPGLAFNIDILPEHIPLTRYVADWWFSLYLVLCTEISIPSKVAIQYRIHPSQESFISANRRKYFEASLHLRTLIMSPLFSSYLNSYDDNQLRTFWMTLNGLGPIYGNKEFGGSVLDAVGYQVANSLHSFETRTTLFGELLAQRGVFVGPNELRNFVALRPGLNAYSTDSNFSLSALPGSCEPILRAAHPFINTNIEPSFLIGCLHNSNIVAEHRLDCSKFYGTGLDQDVLIAQLTIQLEKSGYFHTTYSAGEIYIFRIVKKIKNLLPERIISLFASIRRT